MSPFFLDTFTSVSNFTTSMCGSLLFLTTLDGLRFLLGEVSEDSHGTTLEPEDRRSWYSIVYLYKDNKI